MTNEDNGLRPAPIRRDLTPYQRDGLACVACFHAFLPGEPGEPFAQLTQRDVVVARVRACAGCRSRVLVPTGWERLDIGHSPAPLLQPE